MALFYTIIDAYSKTTPTTKTNIFYSLQAYIILSLAARLFYTHTIVLRCSVWRKGNVTADNLNIIIVKYIANSSCFSF